MATYAEIGIRSFGRGIFHKEPILGADLGAKRVFEIHPGDVVFNNVFAWEGAVALAGASEAGKIGSHRFMTYVPKEGAVDPAWARYFFISEPGISLLRQASPGSAGRNRTLAVDRFENLAIPLPHLDLQHRVVARLDAVIGRVSRCRALTGRSSILSDALPPSMALRPDLTAELKAVKRWIHVPLRDVMWMDLDEHPVSADGSYPNVGVLSFARGLFEKAPIEGARTTATKLYRIRAGQFVYSRLFAFEGAYATVPSRFDGFFVSSEFPTFTVDPECVALDFLEAYFAAPSVWRELAGGSRGLGLRRQRLHAERLLEHVAWLPPIETQRLVAGALRKLRSSADMRSARAKRIDALGLSTLNRAFAGEM